VDCKRHHLVNLVEGALSHVLVGLLLSSLQHPSDGLYCPDVDGRRRRVPMRAIVTAVVGSLLGATTLAASDSPTFYKDVLPILQPNCQSGHRPGEVAPMSLLTYESARPWARAIKTAVAKKQMPPWFADPNYGHFTNERKLSDRAIATISAWADGGAPA